ncbi:BQ5605_C006g04085 [Microbotryum silenes-dioicae]|uniref:BQ5605_C006g04085 protein n=1 Tax=Microbotryum silenes-dioicae TaxID=796604 RepID=A0A2X0M8Y3_9BASI|nr:BQ5605_C006g04085 [Microbotryum silenes-dioicae]
MMNERTVFLANFVACSTKPPSMRSNLKPVQTMLAHYGSGLIHQTTWLLALLCLGGLRSGLPSTAASPPASAKWPNTPRYKPRIFHLPIINNNTHYGMPGFMPDTATRLIPRYLAALLRKSRGPYMASP